MLYTEAFKALGYQLENVRQDWSAEKPDGICISIWKKEAAWTPPPPHVDFFELYPEGGGEWTWKSGHKKRRDHLQRAIAEFQGVVDVVIVSGTPGESYEDADPWFPAKRRNHVWKVTRFDPASGLFRAEAIPTSKGH